MSIILKNISYSIANRTLLDRVNLALPDGGRFGFIGRNGAGKTTLFRLLLGDLVPEVGSLEMPKKIKIVTVAQEVPSGTITPFDFLLQSDRERTALMTELETTEDATRLSDIYDQLIHRDAFTADARASKLLKGLGFDEKAQQRPMDSFSGGYRMRVALAAALFQTPDLLLLDEPTNHLDFEAVTWLKSFLRHYPRTLLLISHDRDLLNHCVEDIIHLYGKQLTRYKGNYDQFEKTFALKQATTASFNAKVDAQKAHWMSFVNRFRAGTKSRQAQSRLKAVEKLSYLQVIEDDSSSITLSFPVSSELATPFLTYDKLFLGYDDNVILKHISGSLGPEDRIALLGANGNGKSTFAKFLANRLTPLKGEVYRDSKLRVGFFHQHQLEELVGELSAYQHVEKLLRKESDTGIRTYLGRFGFSSEKADLQVKKLSGGEKARLALALICTTHPHILVLDEPTNHLDMDMRQSLMMAVNTFPGAVVIISHDWHFLKHTVDQLWVVGKQKITPFSGTLEEYAQKIH